MIPNVMFSPICHIFGLKMAPKPKKSNFENFDFFDFLVKFYGFETPKMGDFGHFRAVGGGQK